MCTLEGADETNMQLFALALHDERLKLGKAMGDQIFFSRPKVAKWLVVNDHIDHVN